METIRVRKLNHANLAITSDSGIAQELNEFFSFFVPGYKFMPAFRNRMWDGKIRLFALRDRTLPAGLFYHLNEFSENLGFIIDSVTNGYGSPDASNIIKPDDLKHFLIGLDLPVNLRDYQFGCVGEAITRKRAILLSPTGSGKSTTLAAIINQINESRPANIITIEDPVEFIHKDKKSIVSQREVGKQTESFSHALKAALREDPDVILVGELRDLETIGMALTAAETGHLVFGTLHTSGAPNTVNRIIDVFPPEQQSQIRAQISTSLKMVVTQRLLKTKDGQGRVGAFEVMKCTPPIQNLIREAKIHQIPSIMKTAGRDGKITM